MKRPEKIKCENCAMSNKGKRCGESIACVNYNEAIEDYEKFLPNEKELEQILLNAKKKHENSGAYTRLYSYLAKAIYNRQQGITK